MVKTDSLGEEDKQDEEALAAEQSADAPSRTLSGMPATTARSTGLSR